MPDTPFEQMKVAARNAWSRAEEADTLARNGEWEEAQVVAEIAQAWALIHEAVRV